MSEHSHPPDGIALDRIPTGDLDEQFSDDEAESDVQAEWDAEIEKRVAEIDSGQLVGLSYEEMMAKLRAKFKCNF